MPEDLHAVALVALFILSSCALTWRLWVGVPPSERTTIFVLFGASLVLGIGTRWWLGVEDVLSGLAGATFAYSACIAVTRGHPERMLELWRIGGEVPTLQKRRSVLRHQLAFCTVIGVGVWLYFAMPAAT
jgi:hypothetical protein